MTDYGKYDEGADEEEFDEITGQPKKKKKGETDTQGREQVQVTEGFYAYMSSIGASKNLVAEVLRNWRHLTGESLVRALMDFAQRLSSRATAHVEVEIDKNKDFGLVHNLIQFFKGKDKSPAQRQSLDSNKLDPK